MSTRSSQKFVTSNYLVCGSTVTVYVPDVGSSSSLSQSSVSKRPSKPAIFSVFFFVLLAIVKIESVT